MIASMLMPSRERVELARKSIDSLGEGDFEVIIAIDKDDPQKKDYLKLKSDKVIVMVCQPYGYENLHKYFNLMSQRSRGDWLVLWNDDATMRSPNWLGVLARHDHTQPLVLDLWHGTGNLFPALSRKYYEIIGHYSLSAHCDSWPENVAVQAGVQLSVPEIYIDHIGEGMSDQVHKNVQKIVRTTSPQFYSPEYVAIREQEVQKIIKYKERQNGN